MEKAEAFDVIPCHPDCIYDHALEVTFTCNLEVGYLVSIKLMNIKGTFLIDLLDRKQLSESTLNVQIKADDH